jgi:hypothetical protein
LFPDESKSATARTIVKLALPPHMQFDFEHENGQYIARITTQKNSNAISGAQSDCPTHSHYD